ncbi:hypothetical protein GCM10010421_22560 [Streptomyces glaucus]|uniref:N-acetyltransferase domain-containing protein n=1 Tax=Streptomyces glaucus TaxID=284029 RepID=A0ABP5WS97_9ACTN
MSPVAEPASEASDHVAPNRTLCAVPVRLPFNAVVETNVHAVQLYRSLGFGVLGTVPEGFRHPTEGYAGLRIVHRAL